MPAARSTALRVALLVARSAPVSLTAAAAVSVLFGAAAQEHRHEHASPYAGQEDSGIAALTVEELQALADGEGMGMAGAAELHHYPGPKHVLELADELGLTADQRARVEESRDRMLSAARRLGGEILRQERGLDGHFVHGHASPDVVRQITARIGALRAELRAVHLVAHLETRAILGERQVRAYDRARGYADGEGARESQRR